MRIASLGRSGKWTIALDADRRGRGMLAQQLPGVGLEILVAPLVRFGLGRRGDFALVGEHEVAVVQAAAASCLSCWGIRLGR